MKDHIIFDASSEETVIDSDNIGAYVRSGDAGALVTHHSRLRGAPSGFSFVDGDVTVGSDSINEVGHGLFTGDKVRLTTSGVLPTGLALLTDYYVIRVDADNFKLASSAYNAEWNNPVDITAAAGGGTHNVVGQDQDVKALDVFLMNPSISVTQGTSPWVIGDGGGSITVDAVDLDIRDLAFATDKVDVSGSTVELGATTLAALETITVNQGTSPWVVQAGAEKAEDSAHSSGDVGNFILAVRNDADASMVSADGDYAPLQVNANGRLKVDAELDVDFDYVYAEDSAHASGDLGAYILAVRQDTLSSSTSADGDYGSFKINALGELYVTSSSDPSLANSSIANAAETLDVANTAQNIVASPLSNRKYLYVYNNDNQKMFIGASGVTSSNGFPISPGSYMELRIGSAVDIEFVSPKLNHEIRTMELS